MTAYQVTGDVVSALGYSRTCFIRGNLRRTSYTCVVVSLSVLSWLYHWVYRKGALRPLGKKRVRERELPNRVEFFGHFSLSSSFVLSELLWSQDIAGPIPTKERRASGEPSTLLWGQYPLCAWKGVLVALRDVPKQLEQCRKGTENIGLSE